MQKMGYSCLISIKVKLVWRVKVLESQARIENNASVKSQDKSNFKTNANPLSNRDSLHKKKQSMGQGYSKIRAIHNIDTNVRLPPSENENEIQSPSYNALDTVESPSKNMRTESDYYGSYARIPD